MAEKRAGFSRKARPYERRHLRQQRQMQIPHPGQQVRDDKRGERVRDDKRAGGFGMTSEGTGFGMTGGVLVGTLTRELAPGFGDTIRQLY